MYYFIYKREWSKMLMGDSNIAVYNGVESHIRHCIKYGVYEGQPRKIVCNGIDHFPGLDGGGFRAPFRSYGGDCMELEEGWLNSGVFKLVRDYELVFLNKKMLNDIK